MCVLRLHSFCNMCITGCLDCSFLLHLLVIRKVSLKRGKNLACTCVGEPVQFFFSFAVMNNISIGVYLLPFHRTRKAECPLALQPVLQLPGHCGVSSRLQRRGIEEWRREGERNHCWSSESERGITRAGWANGHACSSHCQNEKLEKANEN